MVETAETDIVAGAVAADDPLAATCQIALELYDLTADVALVGRLGGESRPTVAGLARSGGIILGGQPCGGCLLERLWSLAGLCGGGKILQA